MDLDKGLYLSSVSPAEDLLQCCFPICFELHKYCQTTYNSTQVKRASLYKICLKNTNTHTMARFAKQWLTETDEQTSKMSHFYTHARVSCSHTHTPVIKEEKKKKQNYDEMCRVRLSASIMAWEAAVRSAGNRQFMVRNMYSNGNPKHHIWFSETAQTSLQGCFKFWKIPPSLCPVRRSKTLIAFFFLLSFLFCGGIF